MTEPEIGHRYTFRHPTNPHVFDGGYVQADGSVVSHLRDGATILTPELATKVAKWNHVANECQGCGWHPPKKRR